MEILRRNMMTNYYKIIKSYYNDNVVSEKTLLNPSTKIIEETLDSLVTTILEQAEKSTEGDINFMLEQDGEDAEIDKEEVEEMIEKNILLNQIDVIRVVLINIIAFPTDMGNKILKYISERSITTILDEFNTNHNFQKSIIFYYIQYLVSKSEGLLSSYKESNILNEYKIVWNLAYHKGVDSLADLAKQAFIELYEDLLEVYGHTNKVWSMLDRFIYGDTNHIYFTQNEIDVNNKAYLKVVKNVLVRAILSDAYIDLKCIEYEDEAAGDNTLSSEEVEALEYIRDLGNEEEYRLPSDDEVRHTIYSHALEFNTEIVPYREADFDSLEEESKTHVLTINPLSQM